MARWLRKPIVWVVTAEIVVVAAFGATAWHLAARPPAAAAADGPAPSPPRAQPTARKVGPEPAPAKSRAPAPSISATPGLQLSERKEWELVLAVTEYARRYIRDHVLPAVEEAAASRRPASP